MPEYTITVLTEDTSPETEINLRKAANRMGPFAVLRVEAEKTMEERVRDAQSVLERDYHNDCVGVAQDLVDAVQRGEIEDREDFSDRLHEAIDGHHNIIYTHASQIVLMVSHNDGALLEEDANATVAEDGSLNWAALAFAAMYRDVVECFAGLDFDVDDEDGYRRVSDKALA